MSQRVPTLETERLLLKEVTLEHVEAYARHFVNYQVIRHLSAAVPWPYPPGGVRRFFEEQVLPRQGKNRWMWGLFLRGAPGELIGAVELWREGIPEHRGFWLAEERWGMGYMTEACAAVHDFAFERAGFEELIFSNAVGNHRSRRVKEKAGAVRIGLQEARFVDPSLTQYELWRLRREDWRAAQAGR